MGRAIGSPLPGGFPSMPGTPFPVFAVLTGLAGSSGAEVALCPLAHERVALALFFESQPVRPLRTNLADRPQRVQLTAKRFFGSGSTVVQCTTQDVIQLNYGRETGTVGGSWWWERKIESHEVAEDISKKRPGCQSPGVCSIKGRLSRAGFQAARHRATTGPAGPL